MSSGTWQPQTVLRFIKSIPTSTNVALVDTDAGEGYLKAMGNPEGPHVLACELVGTLLAEWLGLFTLEHAIVQVTPEDEIPFARGGFASPGPAFITRAVDGFPWGGDVDTLLLSVPRREAVSQIVVLDTWIRNCDRYRPAPNLRENKDNVFLVWETGPQRGLVLAAIDHTHAFTCGRDLTVRIGHMDTIRDSTVFGRFPAFEALLDREHVRMATDRLQEMDHVTAERFVGLTPIEWEVETPVRAAWALIVDRAAYVAENLEAWLWP